MPVAVIFRFFATLLRADYAAFYATARGYVLRALLCYRSMRACCPQRLRARSAL